MIRKLSRAAGMAAIGRVLLVGELSLIAWRHLLRLDGPASAADWPSCWRSRSGRARLTLLRQVELRLLLVKLEPRLMLGTAVSRVSPVPLPHVSCTARGASDGD